MLGSDSATLTISGTLSEVNADLATPAYLSATPGTDTIDVTAVDSLGSTAVQATVSVTVLPIAPPTIVVPTGGVALGDDSTATISTVSIDYPDGAVPGEQVSVTLSDSTGELSVNAATAGGGGTITGLNTTTLKILGTLPEVNADLATLSHSSDTPGSDTVTVSASGEHGGAATPENHSLY